MMTFNNKLSLYEVFFYFVIIPFFGFGVYYVNYVFILIGFVLAIPLNFLIFKEFKKEGKEKTFFKNKLQALGVGLIFVLLILANSKYGFF